MAGYYPLPVGKCRCGACTPDERTPDEETAGSDERVTDAVLGEVSGE